MAEVHPDYQTPKIANSPLKQAAPQSVYVSPSKDKQRQEAQQTLSQCPQEAVSYFIQRSPEKQQGPMPDYAKFLTEAPISAGNIEQPAYEPPIFVPAFPPQTAQTPGLPVRYDHYMEVGKAPARTSPSKLPPGF